MNLPTRRRRTLRTAAAAALALVLAGCSGAAHTEPGTHTDPAPAPTSAGDGLPGEHVHGVAFNPADGKVYLATHQGLFRYDPAGPVQVGPVIDLMGFAAAGPDHFYSSGHPGPGVQLPNPVGLIESTDGGKTWTPLSRQGETDFHALTASRAGVVGFDGAALLKTTDGQQWATLDPPVEPYALATSPDGTHLVATSRSGPARSADGGTTWQVIGQAPLLQYVHFADDQSVVGVAPDGTVFVSTDAGASWEQAGTVGEAPQAIAARTVPDGELEVVVVTAGGLRRSVDGGATFTG